MITCKECIERLKPDDPRIPVGRYHHSTCDYFCNKSDYDRELEGMKEEPLPRKEDAPWVANQWDTIKQMRAMILFLQVKLNEHIDASKRKGQGKY